MKALKYKIFKGYNHLKNTDLFQVIGINNDFVGDWHNTKQEANEELKNI